MVWESQCRSNTIECSMALNNSGIALSLLGRPSEAIARLGKAIRLTANKVSAQRNLAKARAMMQQAPHQPAL